MSAKTTLLCLILFLAGGLTGALGQGIDPHQLYEMECAGCHNPHAGDFVHDSLIQSEGRTLGRNSGAELGSLLEAGHGNLSQDEINAMVSHLTSIQRSGRLFSDKCRSCHNRAVTLARRELYLRDGELVGRHTGRNMERFLSGHGRLNPKQISRMVEVLTRQLLRVE